jgi:TrmH family RNA methyltransferase
MITKNQIKLIKSLTSKKNRVKHQLFVVEGEKNIAELLSSNYEIVSLFANIDWINKNLNEIVIKVTNAELERISNLNNPNNVLALVKIKNHIVRSSDGCILVLDNINDPGNLGTIIRMCDWFGIKTIVCSINTVDSYNPKVVQSAMGSVFRVDIVYADLSEYLEGIQTPIFGSFLNGDNVKEIAFPDDIHLVMGNESNGISKDLSKFITNKVKINNIGKTTESLNVAMAASILLYEICN